MTMNTMEISIRTDAVDKMIDEFTQERDEIVKFISLTDDTCQNRVIVSHRERLDVIETILTYLTIRRKQLQRFGV